MKNGKMGKRKSIEFMMFTYEVLWVIILALLGNMIYGMSIDFKQSIDWVVVIKLVSLVFLTFFYSAFYKYFKETYSTSQDDYKESLIEYRKVPSATYPDIDKIFSEKFILKYYWFLVVSVLMILVYLLSPNFLYL